MSTEPREAELDEEGLPGSAGHFTAEQVTQLNARIERRLLKQLNKGGQSLTYLEAYSAINQLNRVFGYGSWSFAVGSVDREEGDEGIVYFARCTLTVAAPDGTISTHEDEGSSIAARVQKEGTLQGKVRLDSRETARKGAISDALKRCARAFGEQFGNSLYDRDYLRQRDAEERQAATAARQQTQPATQRATSQQRPAQTNDEAEAAALETQQRRLHEMTQSDKEGKTLLQAYLKPQGKTRISEMTMAEVIEWQLVFHDRQTTPYDPPTVPVEVTG
jgi:DNA repair and recombination protein RAD52